jgi:mannose-6-phosphate isomerase-like protein (cupin superfamily)
MNRTVFIGLLIVLSGALGWGVGATKSNTPGAKPSVQDAAAKDTAGYIFEQDAAVAKSGPAPHNGPGRSTGYSFFEKAQGLKWVFRKRVLHPGAAIGYHPQKEDEIYYILSGAGIMQMNGKEFPVKPGDAILTRPGSSHGLKQSGAEDLVLMISYEKLPSGTAKH